MASLWQEAFKRLNASKNPLASVACGRYKLTQIVVEVVAIKATLEAFNVEFSFFCFTYNIVIFNIDSVFCMYLKKVSCVRVRFWQPSSLMGGG